MSIMGAHRRDWHGPRLTQDVQPGSAVGAGEEGVAEVHELYRIDNRSVIILLFFNKPLDIII